MWKNYLKVAFRNIRKHRGYTSINLLGLALGLASGILIFLYVTDELAFDRFHEKGARIYRVITVFGKDDVSGAEGNGWPVGMVLQKDFPEVESVVYLKNSSFLPINFKGKQWQEKSYFATGNFFDVFSFELTQGDQSTALTQPNSVVLTEELEQKYFPGEHALGKTLVVSDTLSLVVSGVMKNIPSQSHMQFGMLISFPTYERMDPDFSFDDGWGNINMRNYVLLHENADVEHFKQKAHGIYMERVGDQMKNWGMEAYVNFEPLQEIYLHSKTGNGMGPLGSMSRVYLVSGTAIFVILLACINFINLATARSVSRAKEVGLRKVVGSSRMALVRQFLSESIVVTFLSFLIAILLMALFLPSFNQLLDKAYVLADLFQPAVMAGAILLMITVAVLAGYYPAWVLSAVKPTEVLKGKIFGSTRGVRLRQTLVTFQFAVSVGLVLGTLVVQSQLEYMRNENLGFAKDQIMVLNISRVKADGQSSPEVMRNDLLSLPSVQDVSFSNAMPGRPGWQGQIASSEKTPTGESVSVEYVAVDEHYVPTLGLKMVAGRNFDPARKADMADGLVINQKAAEMFGWMTPEEAIDQKIISPSGYPAGTVIGVVKDYHELGLQQQIGPVVMDVNPRSSYYFLVKFDASKTDDLIARVGERWKMHYPENDFQYFFLNEDFERQYQSEKRLSRVFIVFSGITILIAVIGLLGLVSFMITARTKEIGIRKVLGANVFIIARLLSTEFLLLVLLANLIACPLIFYFADNWLSGFAYRTSLGVEIFALTLLMALLLTMLTISVQTIRAALVNPVRSLRYE